MALSLALVGHTRTCDASALRFVPLTAGVDERARDRDDRTASPPRAESGSVGATLQPTQLDNMCYRALHVFIDLQSLRFSALLVCEVPRFHHSGTAYDIGVQPRE